MLSSSQGCQADLKSTSQNSRDSFESQIMNWNHQLFLKRISSQSDRVRYEAGSPNPAEIEVFSDFCRTNGGAKCLVLGMTPELRRMACQSFSEVTSVDANPEAIGIYRDWVSSEREQVIQDDWFGFLERHNGYYDVVLGDGIFGNLSSADDASELLGLVRQRLAAGGLFVSRVTLMPGNFRSRSWRLESLLKGLRNREIGECDFGLTSRLISQADSCYDAESEMLDCAQSFALLRKANSQGLLTNHELALAERFLFEGANWLPTLNSWMAKLTESKFGFEPGHLKGHLWYEYYPIHSMFKI